MWNRKLLLARSRPRERALAVGDEAVHRDAHRVDQHRFKLVAPERRTIIVTEFTISLRSGLLPSAVGSVTSRLVARSRAAPPHQSRRAARCAALVDESATSRRHLKRHLRQRGTRYCLSADRSSAGPNRPLAFA